MMEASSKDLLVRFAGSASLSERPAAPPPSEAAAAVELSLGLSLGGSFGSESREKRTKTKLIRSSSISSFPFFASEILSSPSSPSPSPSPSPAKETAAAAAAEEAPLARTWSLPVAGVEEDYRKRKELQSMKRMEAKRKRTEKRNSVARAAEDFGGCPWPPGSRRSASSAAARGSSSGSSGGSGDARPMKGLDIPKFSSSSPESKSPLMSSLPPLTSSSRSEVQQPSKRLIERRAGSWTGEMERSMMEEMPCVSTRGDGPDGRRIEGFLYKYRKGEEVRIVCVCHGSFLTPAEFVRHAGGADVDHPLKHIVVNHHRTAPSPSPSPSSALV